MFIIGSAILRHLAHWDFHWTYQRIWTINVLLCLRIDSQLWYIVCWFRKKCSKTNRIHATPLQFNKWHHLYRIVYLKAGSQRCINYMVNRFSKTNKLRFCRPPQKDHQVKKTPIDSDRKKVWKHNKCFYYFINGLLSFRAFDRNPWYVSFFSLNKYIAETDLVHFWIFRYADVQILVQ